MNTIKVKEITTMQSAVFNPRVYELMGGTIIDFDPAYDSRRRAREREAARQEEIEMKRKRARLRKAKMRQQKLLGLSILMLAIICIILSICLPSVQTEMRTVAFFMGAFSMLPITAKRPIL